MEYFGGRQLFVSALDFGADPAYTATVNTEAIQKAVDRANALGSLFVFLHPGTYQCNALTGTTGITFVGDNASLIGYTVQSVLQASYLNTYYGANLDTGLRTWKAALARSTDITALPSVVFIGDSITDAAGATGYETGFVAQFRGAIQLEYGLAGHGFITVAHNVWTTTGWTLISTAGTNKYYIKAVPATANATITDTFLTVDVIYAKGAAGGTANIEIDNVFVGTINCNAASTSYHNVATFTATSYGTHTVKIIPAASGETYVEGIKTYSGYGGVIVDMVGHPGLAAVDYTGTPLDVTASISAFSPKLTVITLGTNDAGRQVSIASYRAAMTTLVQAGKLSGDVLIVSMGDRFDSPLTIPYASYVDTAKTVAISEGVAWLSIYDLWNQNYTFPNGQGLYSGDGIHPSQKGHQAIAEALINILGGFPPTGIMKLIYESATPYGDIILKYPGLVRFLNKLRIVATDGFTEIISLLSGTTKNEVKVTTLGATYAQLTLGAAFSQYADNAGNATVNHKTMIFNPTDVNANTPGQTTFNGFLKGSIYSRNYNEAVTAAATFHDIVLPNSKTIGDTAYSIVVTPSWNAGGIWYTNKTGTGARINFVNAAPAGAFLDWILLR